MSYEELPAVVDELDPVEPLIRTLPQEKRVLIRQIIAQHYQGPLPPPAMMEDYDRIIPDGANRLMNLLEQQTSHRIAMEEKLVSGNILVTRTGQLIAAVLSVFFGLVAAFLGYFGHDVLAGSIGVTTIIGLAVVFVLGKEPGQRDVDSEADVNPPPKSPPPSSQRTSRKKKTI